MRPAILGLSSTVLTAQERTLLQTRPPAGIILFRRNIDTPDQLSLLMADLRTVLFPQAILMVDQEGGRVARLRPPHWPAHPPAAAYRTADAARAGGALVGLDCATAGFDVAAAPVLDVPAPGADPVIGDRAFGTDPGTVTTLASAFAAGLLEAGIQPVGKHVPGHGRATADSHAALPELDRPTQADLAPFAALAAQLPWLMTAHIRYRDLDPDRPATLSPLIIDRLIRGELAFRGVLVSDDLAMGALSGTAPDRAAAAIRAGCDLALSCAGDLAENAAILEALPPITEAARRRMAEASSLAAGARRPLDPTELRRRRDAPIATAHA